MMNFFFFFCCTQGVRGRTHLKLVRELDGQGANLHVTANREQIAFTAEFLRDDL
jgi:hypothetical protein